MGEYFRSRRPSTSEVCSHFLRFFLSESIPLQNTLFKIDVFKGDEIRDTKTLNLSRNSMAFQVVGRCFSFFTLHDQLVAPEKHLLRVEEMQHVEWLICSVLIQDGGITTNLLRDKFDENRATKPKFVAQS